MTKMIFIKSNSGAEHKLYKSEVYRHHFTHAHCAAHVPLRAVGSELLLS